MQDLGLGVLGSEFAGCGDSVLKHQPFIIPDKVFHLVFDVLVHLLELLVLEIGGTA